MAGRDWQLDKPSGMSVTLRMYSKALKIIKVQVWTYQEHTWCQNNFYSLKCTIYIHLQHLVNENLTIFLSLEMSWSLASKLSCDKMLLHASDDLQKPKTRSFSSRKRETSLPSNSSTSEDEYSGSGTPYLLPQSHTLEVPTVLGSWKTTNPKPRWFWMLPACASDFRFNGSNAWECQCHANHPFHTLGTKRCEQAHSPQDADVATMPQSIIVEPCVLYSHIAKH